MWGPISSPFTVLANHLLLCRLSNDLSTAANLVLALPTLDLLCWTDLKFVRSLDFQGNFMYNLKGFDKISHAGRDIP